MTTIHCCFCLFEGGRMKRFARRLLDRLMGIPSWAEDEEQRQLLRRAFLIGFGSVGDITGRVTTRRWRVLTADSRAYWERRWSSDAELARLRREMEQNQIVLSPEAFDEFVAMLAEPTRPCPNLRRAFQQEPKFRWIDE